MTVRLAKLDGQATILVLTAAGEVAGEVNAKITWYPGAEEWGAMIARMLAEAERRAANGAADGAPSAAPP